MTHLRYSLFLICEKKSSLSCCKT